MNLPQPTSKGSPRRTQHTCKHKHNLYWMNHKGKPKHVPLFLLDLASSLSWRWHLQRWTNISLQHIKPTRQVMLPSVCYFNQQVLLSVLVCVGYTKHSNDILNFSLGIVQCKTFVFGFTKRLSINTVYIKYRLDSIWCNRAKKALAIICNYMQLYANKKKCCSNFDQTPFLISVHNEKIQKKESFFFPNVGFNV